jgi:hypothetical protein
VTTRSLNEGFGSGLLMAYFRTDKKKVVRKGLMDLGWTTTVGLAGAESTHRGQPLRSGEGALDAT